MFSPCPKPEPRQKKPKTRLKVRNRNGLPTKVRDEVFERDKHCLECGSTYALHPHHLVRRRQCDKEWRHDLRNLWTLCWICHGKTETDQRFYKYIQDKAKVRFGWFAGKEWEDD